MKWTPEYTARSFGVLGVGVALYALGAVYFGWEEVLDLLGGFRSRDLVLLGVFSLLNYGLRFWRWDVLLRDLGITLSFRSSVVLYFSTYVMVITPGKIGEIFKAGILRDRYGVPLSQGIPVVLAERIYDFLAVLTLAVAGAFLWNGPLGNLKSALLFSTSVPVFMILFRQKTFRSRLIDRAAHSSVLARHRIGIDGALLAMDRLLTWKPATRSFVISVFAWFWECLGLWLVCRGLGVDLGLGPAVFIYATGTLVGSMTFLPGGLGGTEAVFIWLLGTLAVSGATGAAVAFLVRLYTLWLAVGIGLLFFLAFRRELLSAPEPEGCASEIVSEEIQEME